MNNKILIVSIKPEYAEKIFVGDKTIELRKCAPNVSKGDKIIIYVTEPVKAIKAIGTIDEIVKGSPNVIWKKYSKKTGITRATFFNYYSNTLKAVGIVISDICILNEEVKLEDIKKRLPKFSPPQTFKYFTEIEALHNFNLIQSPVA